MFAEVGYDVPKKLDFINMKGDERKDNKPKEEKTEPTKWGLNINIFDSILFIVRLHIVKKIN